MRGCVHRRRGAGSPRGLEYVYDTTFLSFSPRRFSLRCFRFFAKCPGNLSGRRHRTVWITRPRFLLRNRPTAGFVRSLTATVVVNRLFADLASGVLGRWRAGIERWMGCAFRAFLLSRLAVAYAGILLDGLAFL